MCTKWQVSLIFRLVRGRNYRHIYIIQVNLGILEIPHRLHTSRGLDNKINDEKLVLQTCYSEYPYSIASRSLSTLNFEGHLFTGPNRIKCEWVDIVEVMWTDLCVCVCVCNLECVLPVCCLILKYVILQNVTVFV